NAAANEILQVLCDRCHAAWAKVEVITKAGPVFFCQHHHKKYRQSVIAAGHQIRAMLGPYGASGARGPRPQRVAIQPGWLGVRELRSGAGGGRGEGLVPDLL